MDLFNTRATKCTRSDISNTFGYYDFFKLASKSILRNTLNSIWNIYYFFFSNIVIYNISIANKPIAITKFFTSLKRTFAYRNNTIGDSYCRKIFTSFKRTFTYRNNTIRNNNFFNEMTIFKSISSNIR